MKDSIDLITITKELEEVKNYLRESGEFRKVDIVDIAISYLSKSIVMNLGEEKSHNRDCKMNKEYKRIKPGESLETAVNKLLDYKSRGVLAYIDFNGTALYSDTVTMDDAYKKITGKSKEEFDKFQEEQRNRLKKEQEEHYLKIPELTLEWQRKGREVLTEDKWEYWDKIVPIRLDDLYEGMELGHCLDIVKILNNNGTLDEAKNKIESQGHSGMSFTLVCSMVKAFCSRGDEFSDYIK